MVAESGKRDSSDRDEQGMECGRAGGGPILRATDWPWLDEGVGHRCGWARTPSSQEGRGADEAFERHVPGGWRGSSVPWGPGWLASQRDQLPLRNDDQEGGLR